MLSFVSNISENSSMCLTVYLFDFTYIYLKPVMPIPTLINYVYLGFPVLVKIGKLIYMYKLDNLSGYMLFILFFMWSSAAC